MSDRPRSSGSNPEPGLSTEIRPNLLRRVRIIALFYYSAAALGLVGTVLEVIGMFESGRFTIAVPAGIGMSAWAIGHGLMHRRLPAWRWARRLAVAVPSMTTALVILVLLNHENARMSLLGNSWTVEPWDFRVLTGWCAVMVFWGWQFLVLNGADVRRLFGSESTHPSSVRDT